MMIAVSWWGFICRVAIFAKGGNNNARDGPDVDGRSRGID